MWRSTTLFTSWRSGSTQKNWPWYYIHNFSIIMACRFRFGFTFFPTNTHTQPRLLLFVPYLHRADGISMGHITNIMCCILYRHIFTYYINFKCTFVGIPASSSFPRLFYPRSSFLFVLSCSMCSCPFYVFNVYLFSCGISLFSPIYSTTYEMVIFIQWSYRMNCGFWSKSTLSSIIKNIKRTNIRTDIFHNGKHKFTAEIRRRRKREKNIMFSMASKIQNFASNVIRDLTISFTIFFPAHAQHTQSVCMSFVSDWIEEERTNKEQNSSGGKKRTTSSRHSVNVLKTKWKTKQANNAWRGEKKNWKCMEYESQRKNERAEKVNWLRLFICQSAQVISLARLSLSLSVNKQQEDAKVLMFDAEFQNIQTEEQACKSTMLKAVFFFKKKHQKYHHKMQRMGMTAQHHSLPPPPTCPFFLSLYWKFVCSSASHTCMLCCAMIPFEKWRCRRFFVGRSLHSKTNSNINPFFEYLE